MRVPPVLLAVLVLAATPAFAGTMRVDWSASITEIEDCSSEDYCSGDYLVNTLAGLGAVGQAIVGSFRYDADAPASPGPNASSVYAILGFEVNAAWHFVADLGRVEIRNDWGSQAEDRVDVGADDLLSREAAGRAQELVFFDTVRLTLRDPGASALGDQSLPGSLDGAGFPVARFELWRSSCWLDDDALCTSSNASARVLAEVQSLETVLPEPGIGVLVLFALSAAVLGAGKRR